MYPDEQELNSLARAAFQGAIGCFAENDFLHVDFYHSHIRVTYICHQMSGDSEKTQINMRCHFDPMEMWIGTLRVATEFRSRGVGTQMAQAAEAVGRRLGMKTVSVLPFQSARRFWPKLGYHPHLSTAHAMSKSLYSPVKTEATRGSSALTVACKGTRSGHTHT